MQKLLRAKKQRVAFWSNFQFLEVLVTAEPTFVYEVALIDVHFVLYRGNGFMGNGAI